MTVVDSSQRAAAKTAGFMLLLLMAAGFFSQVFVPADVLADDAGQTARNILDSERLFRIGSSLDILIFAGDMVMAVAFFRLLHRVRPGLALLGLVLRSAQATIMGLNTITFLVVPVILTDPALSADGRQGLARAFVDLHEVGFSVGLVFLGLGNAVFAYVLLRTSFIPRILAAWGVFANVVLASFTLTILVLPSAEDLAAVGIARFVPVFFFEVIAGAWLLFRRFRPATG